MAQAIIIIIPWSRQPYWKKEEKTDECHFWETALPTELSLLPQVYPKGFPGVPDVHIILGFVNFEAKHCIFIFTELSLKFSISFYYQCGQQTVAVVQ